jgi:hypothetical protein
MNGAPKSHSRRSVATERGIAYGMRVLGRRSPRSSLSAGKPRTWRRGTGDLMTHVERYARCETPQPFWTSFENVADVMGQADGDAPAQNPGRLSEVPRGDSSRMPLAAQVNDTDHWKADLRSKDSRAVWRGAVGKVPAKVTRWQPTLLHVRF